MRDNPRPREGYHNSDFKLRHDPFSKKIDMHIYALSLYFVFYNFVQTYKAHKLAPGERGVTEERLVIVAIPPLAILLAEREKQKGSPLDEQEVIEIRNNAVCITLPESAAVQMAQARGYDDISLENPWGEWCALRTATSNQTGTLPDSR